jgi:hypothetical protein
MANRHDGDGRVALEEQRVMGTAARIGVSFAAALVAAVAMIALRQWMGEGHTFSGGIAGGVFAITWILSGRPRRE